jgi:hypothetical protein
MGRPMPKSAPGDNALKNAYKPAFRKCGIRAARNLGKESFGQIVLRLFGHVVQALDKQSRFIM